MKCISLFFLGAGMLVLYSCAGNGANGTETPEPKGDQALFSKGEKLFETSCGQCHQAKTDFVGPSLAGVESRWKSKELLYAFIRNPDEVIARDEYAAALYKKWNGSKMLPFPNLSDEDIAAILTYCNSAP